jgi:hypothetical protein
MKGGSAAATNASHIAIVAVNTPALLSVRTRGANAIKVSVETKL